MPPAVLRQHTPPLTLPPPTAALQYPEYVLQRAALLTKLLASDKEVAKRRAACLAYLSPLMRMFASPKVLRSDPAKGGLAAVARGLGASEELAEGLLELFTNSS